jgi:hypothetical protein
MIKYYILNDILYNKIPLTSILYSFMRRYSTWISFLSKELFLKDYS